MQNRRPARPGTGQRPGNAPRDVRPAAAPNSRPHSGAVNAPHGSAFGSSGGRRTPTGGAGFFRRLPRDFWRIVLACVGLVVVCALAQAFLPAITGGTDSVAVSAVYSSGPIRLNELMSRNSGTIVDENGLTADWLEIMNVSNAPVNLEGYMLAKDDSASNVFEFPAYTLEAGECVIVFADSTLRNDAGGEFHAPFKLSSAGGSLMLFSPSGVAIDTVSFPSLSSDTSYVREDLAVWSVSDQPTPGLPNTAENYQSLHELVTGAGVEITEIVASNTQYAPDENGAYQDYIELHNTTGEAIDLSGWYLSDTPGLPLLWRIPDGFVLQPGECRNRLCLRPRPRRRRVAARQLRPEHRGRDDHARQPRGAAGRSGNLRPPRRRRGMAQAGGRLMGNRHALARRRERLNGRGRCAVRRRFGHLRPAIDWGMST